MVGAVLNQTNLQDADLSYASMSDASLVNSWIIGAKLYGTYLANANLKGVSSGGNHGTPAALPPRGTDVSTYLVGPYAQLGNAGLSNADLAGVAAYDANLSGADLVNDNLSGANLSYSDLTDAYRAGANLTGADIEGAKLSGSTWSTTTTCPNGVLDPNKNNCYVNGDG